MVQSGSTIKAKIEKKIFSTPPASNITIATVTRGDGSLGGYGGTSKTYGTPVATVGVPYGFISGDRKYMKMGFNSEGETKIAVPADTVVKQGDKITITSESLVAEVFKINEYPFNDVNLARILLIKEFI